MISMRNLTWVGLVGSLLLGCGGSDDAPGGSSVSPSDCPAVAAKLKALSGAVGCDDSSADIEASCKFLYEAKTCTSEWAGLINCVAPKPSSDFQCDSDNELEPKAGVCASQKSAFDACLGD